MCGIIRHHNWFYRNLYISVKSSSSNKVPLGRIYIFGKPVKTLKSFIADIIVQSVFTIFGAVIGVGICSFAAVYGIENNNYYFKITNPGLLAAESFLCIGKWLLSYKRAHKQMTIRARLSEIYFYIDLI